MLMSCSNHKSDKFPIGNFLNLNARKFRHLGEIVVSGYMLQVTDRTEIITIDI